MLTSQKKGIVLFAAAIAAIGCMVKCKPGVVSPNGNHYRVTTIPTDVLPTCTVSAGQFANWFVSGTAAAKGAVKPANSVGFPSDAAASDTDFYKWSEQMFLWITSPVDDKSIVLEHSNFFMVLPDSSNGTRRLVQCEPGILTAASHIKELSGHNGAFLVDRKGKVWRVVRGDNDAQGNNATSADNQAVKIARIEEKPTGGHKFFDDKNKEIAAPKALAAGKPLVGNVAKRVIINGKAVLLSANGEVDADAETAQATNNALIAQNNGLIHYILFVNDFYAYYATGKKNGAFTGTSIDSLFPTDTIGRNLVCKYARDSFGVTINDSNALAIELKASFVEVNDQLLDKDSFITLKATVPVFNHFGDTVWVQDTTKTKPATLALTGMHIVGSVFGQPEMIWATFEHNSNAPNMAYVYTNTSNTITTHPADSCANWLLHNNNCDSDNTNGLIANRTKGQDSIKAPSGQKIGPRNVTRQAPWGNFDNSTTNANTVKQNTMVMSINNSVRGQLAALGSDIRTKYQFVGALWTNNGVVPNPLGIDSFQAPCDTINARGGIQLANSTMETYMILKNTDAGCFDCHNGTLNPSTPDGLSHIFSQINPLTVGKKLPKAPDAMKK